MRLVEIPACSAVEVALAELLVAVAVVPLAEVAALAVEVD